MGQHAAAGSQRPLAIAAALRHADTHVGRRRPIVQVAAGRIGAAARIPRCGQGIGHIAALIQVAGDPRRNIRPATAVVVDEGTKNRRASGAAQWDRNIERHDRALVSPGGIYRAARPHALHALQAKRICHVAPTVRVPHAVAHGTTGPLPVLRCRSAGIHRAER
ncbi:hypothetical protein G6F35_016771 [Rhizopus arrhizus]|nr:hypothetical protein G6F35_016771 [Rhizopus arrhizus]